MFAHLPGSMAFYPWGAQPGFVEDFGLLRGPGNVTSMQHSDVFKPRAHNSRALDRTRATGRQHCSSQHDVPTRLHASSCTQHQQPVGSPCCPDSTAAVRAHDVRNCHRQQQQPVRFTAATACCAPTAAAAAAANRTPGPQTIPVRFASSRAQQQQQHSDDTAATATMAAPSHQRRSASSVSPAQAATHIQTAWRMHRLHKEYPVLKQLAAAAAQLTQVQQQLQEQQQSSIPMTQKQYLQLSEPVMKVLFSIDDTSSSAAEVRAVRKRLSTQADQLLDRIETIYKTGSTAAAAAMSPVSAEAEKPPAPEVFYECMEDVQTPPAEEHTRPEVDMHEVAHACGQGNREDNCSTSSTSAAVESAVSPAVAAPAAPDGSPADAAPPAAPRVRKHRRRRPWEQHQQGQLLRAGLCPSRWWLRHTTA